MIATYLGSVAWTERKYSKGEIDRAGRALVELLLMRAPCGECTPHSPYLKDHLGNC